MSKALRTISAILIAFQLAARTVSAQTSDDPAGLGTSINALAAQGDLKGATPLAERLVQVSRAKGGVELFAALDVLATLYDQQQRADESALLREEAVSVGRTARRAGNPVVGRAMLLLAAHRVRQARLDEAVALMTEARAGLEGAVVVDQGSDRDSLLFAYSNLLELARTTLKLGRAPEADRYADLSLELVRRFAAADTTLVINATADSAEFYTLRQRPAKLEELWSSAVQLRDKAPDRNDFMFLKPVFNLGQIANSKAEYDKAEALLRDALAISERQGINAGYQLLCLNALANHYIDRLRPNDAEPLLKRALQIPSPDPALIAEAETILGSVHMLQDRQIEAQAFFKSGVKRYEALGRPGSFYPAALFLLATSYIIDGQLPEAKPLLEKAYKVQANTVVDSAEPTLNAKSMLNQTLNMMALVALSEGDTAQAERHFLEALRYREDTRAGLDAHLVAVQGLGLLYMNAGRAAEAEKLMADGLETARRARGPEHAFNAPLVGALAGAQEQQAHLAEAEASFKEQVALAERAWGTDHSEFAVACNQLAAFYRRAGRKADAETYFARAAAVPNVFTAEIPILFATDRALAEKHGLVNFSADRGRELTLGRAVVLAPRAKVKGRATRRVEGSGFLDRAMSQLTNSADMILRDVKVVEGLDLSPPVSTATGKTTDLLMFVHGFNVGFEDAVATAAQIAFDLDFRGQMLLFTWPTQTTGLPGLLKRYTGDEKAADTAADFLVQYLDRVAAAVPGRKVHFVAHSMGNRILLTALEKIARRDPTAPRITVGEIVSAHPDVDRDRFAQAVPEIERLGGAITIYVSKDDRALLASKLLHRFRVRAGGDPSIKAPVDVIDMTRLGAQLWSTNHSVYAENPIVFGDITRLLASGTRPVHVRTAKLIPTDIDGQTYWRYGGDAAETSAARPQ